MIKGKRYRRCDSAYSEYVYTCKYVSKSLAVMRLPSGSDFVIHPNQFNQYEEYVEPTKLFANVYQLNGSKSLEVGKTYRSREEAITYKFPTREKKYITTIEVEV